MIGMRWLMRALGLISTVVLARILSPDDFGIMAMSAIAVELLMMLGDTNVDIALIREPGTQRKIYDSAWTVQAICGIAVTVMVALAAAPLAYYYDDPRVEMVMYILALRPAILGFENVGVAEFRKSLDFAKEFRYNLWRRASLFIIGISLALIFKSYLALAIAAPISAAVAVLFSFTMSSYRPRPQLSHAWLVWGASKWLILQNLSQATLERVDEFIIGGVSSAATVGNYYIAAQTAPLPTREVAWPMERALMPVYSKIITHHGDLATPVVAVLGLMGTFCFAAGVGLMSVAEVFVLFIFGETWHAVIPFFQWLAIFGIFAALGRPFMPLFYALKRERLYAVVTTFQVAVTIPTLVFAAYNFELVIVAASRTVIAAFFFILFCWTTAHISNVRMADMAGVLWRPAIASAVMASAIVHFRNDGLQMHILSLLHDIGIGIFVFVFSQSVLWILAGRPSGPERIILSRMHLIFRALVRPH